MDGIWFEGSKGGQEFTPSSSDLISWGMMLSRQGVMKRNCRIYFGWSCLSREKWQSCAGLLEAEPARMGEIADGDKVDALACRAHRQWRQAGQTIFGTLENIFLQPGGKK